MPDPTNKLNVVIIGQGTVGRENANLMRYKGVDNIMTVDTDLSKKADYASLTAFYKDNLLADVYIINVWNQEQVFAVVKEINVSNNPLISIETTTEIGTYDEVRMIIGDEPGLVLFPERIYPNDQNHGVFNQTRVMGGDWERGRQFYLRYMIYENIIVSNNIDAVELSHLLDNSYRYVLIAIAEELKMLTGSDFEELRRLCNTKWNVCIPEARDGIKGHCLAKDIDLTNISLPNNQFFLLAKNINNKYEEWLEKKK